jgi:hypothetical protein
VKLHWTFELVDVLANTASQTGAIDDMHKAVSKETEPEKVEEGKRITQGLATLKYELQHDRQLS